MKKAVFVFGALWVFVCLGFYGPAQAQDGWAAGDQIRGRIIVANTPVKFQDRAVEAGLDLRLSEGWHTYWRVPGDSGLPPQLDWNGSENVKSAEILWPAPKRLQEGDLTVFAYAGEVFLPLIIARENTDKPFILKAAAQIMVCHDVCIPERLTLTAASDAASSENARLIEMGLRRVPVAERADIAIDTVVLGPEAIAVSLRSTKGFTGADLFAHAGDYPFTAKPELTIDEKDNTRAMVRIPATADVKDVTAFMKGKTLSLTFTVQNAAVEKTLTF